jgi:hypothetical protein
MDEGRLGPFETEGISWIKSKGVDVGLTKPEVLRRLGEPRPKEGDSWTYRKPLGAGMHSHRTEVELVFKQDKVVEFKERNVGIGCVINGNDRDD